MGDLYDQSHSDTETYQNFLKQKALFYKMVAQPDHTWCEDLHTPPDHDPKVAAYFNDGSTVFCAVREPLERFMSAFKMKLKREECDPKSFEDNAREHLRVLKQRPGMWSCLFVPQVEMVYGATILSE